jgi:hypothetical protein
MTVVILYAKYVECHPTECCDAQCFNAERHIAVVIPNVIMVTLIMSFHNVEGHNDECHYAARRGDGWSVFREIIHRRRNFFAKEKDESD